jgi:putative ABC transport system substrate-binding protein
MREVASIARPLGLDATLLEIRSAQDIASAVAAVKGRVQALYVVTDTFAYVQRTRIHTVTLAAQLPTMHGFREYVEAGGLMSYGASFPDLWRRAAVYVDKILRGSTDLPVEQPTKFDLVINLITAKALGLEVPPTLASVW